MKVSHILATRKADRAGFTLMEMILVLAIIALLVGAGVVGMVGVLDDAKFGKAEMDMKAIEGGLIRYQTAALFYPTTEQGLRALVERPGSEPIPRRWTKKMEPSKLLDPWGREFQYLNPGSHNPDSYDLWSVGPDGQEGTGDEIGNWE